MHDLRCPLCGRAVDLDSRGRLDCSEGHRFGEPELWQQARTLQLITDIQSFLDPDSTPDCPAHRWQVVEVRGEFVCAQCEFCSTVAIAVPGGGSGPHQGRSTEE